jgi:hypothetical protein
MQVLRWWGTAQYSRVQLVFCMWTRHDDRSCQVVTYIWTDMSGMCLRRRSLHILSFFFSLSFFWSISEDVWCCNWELDVVWGWCCCDVSEILCSNESGWLQKSSSRGLPNGHKHCQSLWGFRAWDETNFGRSFIRFRRRLHTILGYSLMALPTMEWQMRNGLPCPLVIQNTTSGKFLSVKAVICWLTLIGSSALRSRLLVGPFTPPSSGLWSYLCFTSTLASL